MTRAAPMVMLFIALTIVFTVLEQFQVKRGMLEVGASPTELTRLPRFVIGALSNPQVVFGRACAVVAAVSWTVTVSRSDLSPAYPFVSLASVLVLAFSGDEVLRDLPGRTLGWRGCRLPRSRDSRAG